MKRWLLLLLALITAFALVPGCAEPLPGEGSGQALIW
jgi:hypothetical protein